MRSQVLDEATAEAFDRLSAGLDALSVAGVDPVDAPDAVTVVGELEVVARRVRALQVEALDQIDQRGLHRVDGHASAKVLVRHAAQLSNAEAARRAGAARALRDLPAVREAFRFGQVGSDQVDRIARAHANVRVRGHLGDQDGALVAHARASSYRAFDATVTGWVRRVDEDGTCDRARRSHENRDARMVQDFDGSWTVTAGCGSLQGAELEEIFRRFIDAEFAGDWANARARLGDAATVDDLDRNDGQRRFDAFYEIFQRAASAHAVAEGGSQVVTNIVIDQATFERHLSRLFGTDPGPPDTDLGPAPTTTPTTGTTGPETEATGSESAGSNGTAKTAGRGGSGVGYRCTTLDGRPIDPTEAVATALIDHIRRVVIGADSVVIDLGRRRRCFTGAAQLAARLAATECYWPGCHVPVTDCQIDHLIPWADHGGGSTDPGNGGPACGTHNRYKQRGYRVHRDPAGRWHTYRPDGTEIT
jgi:hypothetical protein